MNEEIKDMKTILTRLFTVALLMMVSMGARAEIKIDLGGKDNNGVYEGGTVTAKQSEAKDGKVTVTLIFTPDKNYSITRKEHLRIRRAIPVPIILRLARPSIPPALMMFSHILSLPPTPSP